MSDRLYLSGEPPRLITSKPGYDASPDLENIYKTFDSEWYQGAGIRWRFQGYLQGPRDVVRDIYFPYPLEYIPRYDFFWGGVGTTIRIPQMVGVTWPVPFPGGPAFGGWGGELHSVQDYQNIRAYQDRIHVERRVGGDSLFPFTVIVYLS